ncbi:hypothetical protein Ancab_019955 [Ancistrocladus abbreviatus]
MAIENESDEYVDWKGKRTDLKSHGGTRAACLACVVEVLENMVFLSNGINFVTYFQKAMHYSGATSANMVTNFMGTSFLLTIFGGFVSDSFLGRFWTFTLFCTVELLGLVLLIIQAECIKFQPARNQAPSSSQAALLYTGLYAVAAGVGGVKATLSAHGADQVDHSNPRRLTSFFNWYFFSLCTGGLLAATFMVWIEDNRGWKWSFKISAIALSLALFLFAAGFPWYRFKLPTGSPLTRIFKVFMSAARNHRSSNIDVYQEGRLDEISSSNKFKFLNKALADKRINQAEVEETRTFLGLLPIFASTILMNCCIAQLQTFSVQQGNIMNKTIFNRFTLPTPSLNIFPLIIMLSSIPIYELLVSLRSKLPKTNTLRFQPLQRIALGLALASAAMAVAAIVEAKRRHAATHDGAMLSVFWLSWQYILLGVSDMLTLGGMLEFFYSEAPTSMRSICTALSWCSTSMGYFLSSVLVQVSNLVSGRFGGGQWLGGSNLNESRLDLFYTLLCVVNFVNFVNYLYWARRY